MDEYDYEMGPKTSGISHSCPKCKNTEVKYEDMVWSVLVVGLGRGWNEYLF